MAETIQTFVEKIRSEGIHAGQQQADELLAKAKQDAEEIVLQAQQEKERLLAQADAEAAATLERSRTDLKLAARDAALRLRDALARALSDILAAGAKAKLEDPEFVGKALHEIVTQYSQTVTEGGGTFRINVSEDMRQRLVDWAMTHIGQEAMQGTHLTIDLKGSLKQAGFEYNATGATVEVTLDSVVEVLSDLVAPKLREALERAMAEGA